MPIRSLKLAIALLASAAAIPSEAAIVDIVGNVPAGTSVMLAAGTYRVTYSGIAGGGMYDAFSYWGDTAGCNAQGTGCARGWSNHFAIDFGGGNGVGYGLATVGGVRQVFETEALALAAFSTSTLQSATLAQIGGNANYFHQGTNAYIDVMQPIMFTLASAQSVRFFIVDTPHSDNRGGVSLNIAAVPEPATWAMMIAGFGLVGGALRRRRSGAMAAA